MQSRRRFASYIPLAVILLGCSTRSAQPIGELANLDTAVPGTGPTSAPDAMAPAVGTDAGTTGLPHDDGPTGSSLSDAAAADAAVLTDTAAAADAAISTDSTAVDADPELCLSSGWCWVAPAHFGDEINAGTHGLEDDSVFAVSRAGHVLQWTHDHWIYHEAVSDQELVSIVALNAHDVWVGGFVGAWHYDGSVWQQQATESVDCLAYAAGKVWATLDGRLYFRDQDSWTEAGPVVDDQRYVTDILSSADGQTLWAADWSRTTSETQAHIYRYQDQVWESLGESPTGFYPPELLIIDGQLHASGAEVWNVEDNWSAWGIGHVYSILSTEQGQTYYSTEQGVWRWDGQVGEQVDWHATHALWPGADGQLWFSPYTGGALRLDPVTGSVESPPSGAQRYRFGSVPTAIWADASLAWGATETDVWRARGTQETGQYTRPVEHFDGKSWQTVLPDREIVDIDGCAADDVWVVPMGSLSLMHWNGQALGDEAFPSEHIRVAHAVRCLSHNDVWLLGESSDSLAAALHYDGETWSIEQTSPYQVSRIPLRLYLTATPSGRLWFSANTDQYAFDGTTWQKLFSFDDYHPTPIAANEDTLWLFSGWGMQQWKDGSLTTLEGPPVLPTSAQLLGSNVWIWNATHALVKRVL